MNRVWKGDRLPVAVIGAGPIGLAVAAHLLQRGQEPLVLEAGDAAGAGVASWGHVRLFTPWRYTIDPAARGLLDQTGWRPQDPDGYPTGYEFVDRYLRPLAAVPVLDKRVVTHTRVVRVARVAEDHHGADDHHGAHHRDEDRRASGGAGRGGGSVFELVLDTPGGAARLLARAVVDASGTVRTPNSMGAAGAPVPGETELGERVRYGLPDVLGAERARFADKHVLVVGTGHSAQNALLDLGTLRAERPDTRISWAVRAASDRRLFGRGSADPVAERGRRGEVIRDLVDTGVVALRFDAQIVSLHEESSGIGARTATGGLGPFDIIVAATGFRPDLTLLGGLELDLDPRLECPRALAPLIDPAVHWCGSVSPHGVDVLAHPEPDVYAVGMKSYGRATSFLMATGYEQVRSVAAALAGDWHAARRVEPAGLGGSTSSPVDLALYAPNSNRGPRAPVQVANCGPNGSCSC